MDDGIDAARLLRRARERSGFSQRALAERAGTAQSVVARIELGRTSPTVPTLSRLLEAAGQQVEVRLVPSTEHLAVLARRWFEARAEAGIVSAYLFGSAARDERHRESDVDVAVLLDPAIHPDSGARSELRVRMGAELVAALGTDGVDLVVLNDVPPGLARAVVLDGRRVFLADLELDHAFSRNVQLRWADLQPFLRRTSRLKLEALTA